MKKHRRRSQRGFTLVELMISLVLFALITAGLMSVAVTMTNGFRDQEVTISTESATRSTMDFLSEAIRGASPGVSSPTAITQIHNCTTGSFAVQNAQAVAGLSTTSDILTVVMPHGSVVTSLTSVYTTGSSSATVSNATGLAAGDYLLITNFTVGHLVRISSVAGTTVNFDAQGGGACVATMPTGGYGIGTVAVRALRARFYVEIPAGETVPMLMMDPDGDASTNNSEPIAEGIENMEIVVGVDTDSNGTLALESGAANGDEWLGNVTGETTYANQPNVRAIRVTLVARTTKAASGVNSYKVPALEDRAASATADNFRRRVLSSVIEVRNLGGSP